MNNLTICAEFNYSAFPYNGTCYLNPMNNSWIIDIPNDTWKWKVPVKKRYNLRSWNDTIIYLYE